MTNKDVLNLLNSLKAESLNDINSFKVNYTIAKNRKQLDDEAKIIKELLFKIDGYYEYVSKRTSIEKEYAENIDFTDQKILYAIDDKAKQLDIESESVLSKINFIFNEQSSLELYKIKAKDFPETLSLINSQILFPFIED